MSPIVLYNDKILLVDNKIATDLSCCCDQECSIIDIVYSWVCNTSRDLDTSTTFLGSSVGWPDAPPPNGCGINNQYLIWDGDNTLASSTEHVRVFVRKALDDNLWAGSVNIDLKAGWFAPVGGTGGAQIIVKLLKEDGTVCKEVCCQTGDLPSQNRCASNNVGSITVTNDGNQIDFTISPCNTCTEDCGTTTTTTTTTEPPSNPETSMNISGKRRYYVFDEGAQQWTKR